MNSEICCECGEEIDKNDGYTFDEKTGEYWCADCEPEG